jgi:uncharacterized protein (TIGR02246 family)
MIRSIRLTLPLVAVVLVACTEGPSSVTAARPPEQATATIGVTDATPDGIAALVAAYSAAWAAKNPVAFAAIYSEDVDVITPVGAILSGRAAVQAQHAFLFGGPFATSTSVSTVRRVDFVTGTVAIVDVDVVLTGYAAAPRGLPEFAPGVVSSRMRLVAVKRGGEWEVVAQQMTPRPAP